MRRPLPNKSASGKGGIRSVLTIEPARPALPEHHRWATFRTMRFITLLLSGALCGCSTAHHPATVRRTNPSPLFLYWGSEDGGTANRFLSAQIHLGEEIFVGGDDFLDLRGHIEP